MFKPEMTYTNARGEVFVFGDETRVYLDESDLFGYEYSFSSQGSTIRATRNMEKKDIKLLFLNDTDPTQINRFLDVVDHDVQVLKPGTLELDGYTRRCLFIADDPEDYMWKPGLMRRDMKLVMIDSYWTCITSYTFPPGEDDVTGGNNYPFDYPHNYSAPAPAQSVINANTSPSDFVLRIYGPISDPSVTIGGNTYKVACDVESGGYLTINSQDKTVINRSSIGVETKAFHAGSIGTKGSGFYLFEKIVPGPNLVNKPRGNLVALDLIEARSEPRRKSGW